MTNLYFHVPEQYVLLASGDDVEPYLPENYEGEDWDDDIRMDFDIQISNAVTDIEDEIILTEKEMD